MFNPIKIQKLLGAIPNPFLQDRVDTPWQNIFYDVPEINRTAFQSCLKSVEAVSLGNQSRGLMLHGEPGSGKTHLLHRLRLYTQKDPRTWFIYIPPFPGPGRFWRHLLECFFYDICQRSKQPDILPESPIEESPKEEGPGQGPLSQIEEALTRHLMARPLDSTQELACWWAKICKQDLPGEALFKRLRPTFDKLTIQFRLDPEAMKVLRHYLTWNNRAVAYAYLVGRDLPDEDLASLGVKQSLDDEERARQAVLTFCRLAGEHFTIILAFDQIEGLQLNPEDFEGLRTYAKGAVELLMQCKNLLVLSALQTYFLPTLDTALHIHSSYRDRIAQDESVLTLLTKESARHLLEFRLGTINELVDLQRKDQRLGTLWPFTDEEIEKLVPIGGLSARNLIRWARHRFDELKEVIKISPPRTREEGISRHWNELFERELQQPHVRLDEGVYEDGLLRLFHSKPPKGWRARRGTERDLSAVLEGKDQKVGVSISNSENMTSLARQLKRLQEILSKGKVNHLIFIRDARLPISETAKVTQRRMKELTQKGLRVVRPTVEAYAALNVLRQLLAKAAENDLTIGETNVSMGELQRWLTDNTPRPLQELMDVVQEVTVYGPDPLTDRLLEVLINRRMISLKDIAQEMGMGEGELTRFVIEKPEVTGFLAGPPAILFLNPEAVSHH